MIALVVPDAPIAAVGTFRLREEIHLTADLVRPPGFCPAESTDIERTARVYDRALQQWARRRFFDRAGRLFLCRGLIVYQDQPPPFSVIFNNPGIKIPGCCEQYYGKTG